MTVTTCAGLDEGGDGEGGGDDEGDGDGLV